MAKQQEENNTSVDACCCTVAFFRPELDKVTMDSVT